MNIELFFGAVEGNYLGEVDKIIGAGININSLDTYGYGALHIASYKGLTDMASLLIERGIDVNMQDKKGGAYCIMWQYIINWSWQKRYW